jgi:hypothetical protein
MITEQKVQKDVLTPVQKFQKVYHEIREECVKRRKSSGVSIDFVAEWLKVDRRKIMDLEKGKVRVGLLLLYADRFDIEVNLDKIFH